MDRSEINHKAIIDVYKNAHIALQSIHDILPKVKDKELKDELKDDLIYLDLSNVSFDNVKVSGLDLSNTNVSIDPQTVYNKDMSNGIYDGIKFISNNFNDVNTDNSSFKNCDVPFSEFEIADII